MELSVLVTFGAISDKLLNNSFYCCTVHSDICGVHSPTNTLLLIKKNTLKFTLKYT